MCRSQHNVGSKLTTQTWSVGKGGELLGRSAKASWKGDLGQTILLACIKVCSCHNMVLGTRREVKRACCQRERIHREREIGQGHTRLLQNPLHALVRKDKQWRVVP